MRKVYINCGLHNGESLRKFLMSKNYDMDFDVYCFEANPIVYKEYKYSEKCRVVYKRRKRVLYDKICRIYNKAVWSKDGAIDFYVGKKDNTSRGCSLIKEKISGGLDLNNPISVPSFDFSRWILDNFNKDDYIIMKMDIEGAEYDILPHMFKHWNHCHGGNISSLSVEFHRDFFPEKDLNFWGGAPYYCGHFIMNIIKHGVCFNWWPGEW